MPDFGMSLGRKAELRSLSMKDGSLKNNAILGESSNLFLPPEVNVPACSLVPDNK